MPVNITPRFRNNLKPTYSRSRSIIFGPLFNYLDTSLDYIRTKKLEATDKIYTRQTIFTERAIFAALFYFLLGLLFMTKLDVVTYSGDKLRDLHEVVTSPDEVLYVDDINMSLVRCKVELVDFISLVIGTVMAIKSTVDDSNPSNLCFLLPWLGMTLKALLLNQIPTTLAFMYIFLLSEERIKLVSFTTLLLVFIMEMRIWFFLAKQFHVQWHRQCLREKYKNTANKSLRLAVEGYARPDNQPFIY